jgi:hypothetical protein
MCVTLMTFALLMQVPAHDCYYGVDCNMVISYIANDIPGWRTYVDHMSRKGKRFFMTKIVHDEASKRGPLPDVFHLFRDGEGELRARSALPALLSAFGMTADASVAQKFSKDLQWLLQSGYSIAGCPDIPELDILSGRAFAITANAKLVRRFLHSSDKRSKFEKVVDDCALEHLADVRTVCKTDGTSVDRSAF